jgi:RNA polymerase-binding transcription factor DksA
MKPRSARIIRPVFGRPCADCGLQVPMQRVRLFEADAAAKGNVFIPKLALTCVDCQQLRENQERRERRAEGPRDITIIRS